MAAPITKAAWRVEHARGRPRACSSGPSPWRSPGRPGPVLRRHPDGRPAGRDRRPRRRAGVEPARRRAPTRRSSTSCSSALAAAERPLILAGGGVRSARAIASVPRFVDRLGVPGRQLAPGGRRPALRPPAAGRHDRQLRQPLGEPGHRPLRPAARPGQPPRRPADRLARPTPSARAATIYHVDCEPGEMNNRVTGCRAVDGRPARLPRAGVRGAEGRAPAGPLGLARRRSRERGGDWPDTAELRDVPGINPNASCTSSRPRSARPRPSSADVGQHQMWAAQSLELSGRPAVPDLGRHGGDGLRPAGGHRRGLALGPGGRSSMIAGDGGFQLNLQELQTVVRNRPADQDGRPQQPLPRHGPPVPAELLRASATSRPSGATPRPTSRPSPARTGSRPAASSDPADVHGRSTPSGAIPTAPYLLEVMIDTFANAYPEARLRPADHRDGARSPHPSTWKGPEPAGPHRPAERRMTRRGSHHGAGRPLISVVTPFYNEEDNVDDCYQAVRRDLRDATCRTTTTSTSSATTPRPTAPWLAHASSPRATRGSRSSSTRGTSARSARRSTA